MFLGWRENVERNSFQIVSVAFWQHCILQ